MNFANAEAPSFRADVPYIGTVQVIRSVVVFSAGGTTHHFAASDARWLAKVLHEAADEAEEYTRLKGVNG